jgi:hypothetical protein
VVADDILRFLINKHTKPGVICIPELKAGCGFAVIEGVNPERAIDLFVMHLWPSKNFYRIAYEIKVSKSDFTKELANKEKRAPFTRFANQFFFVTPSGLLDHDKIPPECGLIEVTGQYHYLKTVINGPYYDNPPTWAFIAAIARRLQNGNT